jgi:hypothetical protein
MIYISQFLSLIEEEPLTEAKEHLEDGAATNNGNKNTIFSKH